MSDCGGAMFERTQRKPRFRDRSDAGVLLGRELRRLRLRAPLVIGLARGGVPVAAAVAAELSGDLDVLIARKIGAPGRPELAIGAIAEDEVVHVDRPAREAFDVDERQLSDLIASERRELERRLRRYRQGRPPMDRAGRDVVLVDDGIATGWTARAALDAIMAAEPDRVVLAVPVCPRSALSRFNDVEVLCLSHPRPFNAVGEWYEDFDQVSDAAVVELLLGAHDA